MASGYDGHYMKRQKTEDGVRGYEESYERQDQRTDERNRQDRHSPDVSPVVHVRGLPDRVIEDDIVAAVQHFGSVAYVILIPRRNQALVEFTDVKGSSACVNFANANQLLIRGQPAYFNYSTSQRIQRPSDVEVGGQPFAPANKILLFTVLNAKYPITVDVMHTICSPHGRVEKIVIFKKQAVQSMVQFENAESAKNAREQLNDCDIYSGCCTLRIEYAKTDELHVRANNNESWDYTIPQQAPTRKNPPLLADPRYTAAPTPYDEFEEYPQQGQVAQGRPGYGGQYGEGDGGYDQGFPQQAGRGMGRGMAAGQRMAPQQYGQEAQVGFGRGAPARGPPLRQEPTGYGMQQQGGYSDQSQMMQGSGPQSGSVLMIYGLDAQQMNCDRVFNILCLYGNVIRIKFLKSKEGAAMVQMGDGLAVERAMYNLNGVELFGKKLNLTLSKQPYLQEVNNPHELSDGSSSYKDCQGNRNNRFSTPEQAGKNRITGSTETLHYFNAPPKIGEDDIRQVFTDVGAEEFIKILQFPSKTERSSTGLLEWSTKSAALEALALANHTMVPNPAGGRPYSLKLCFSPGNIRDSQ
ncbi:heterogeneous nuclear ribonucleoprotein L-like isoform X2 [Mercenaria mercenaria]|uniref:heterogeneous nuclear ribonucleoprotein L-like isoform X2 n=1 Tax=Mercenaria mercenaria TaxID=6596 RepID=UPI00234F70BD|nr:heterogeneous nuclear ribonucleoprotein L-like isoform X2 [Mercenaria mercenaria]